MCIKIAYFAALREASLKDSEELEWEEGVTLEEIYKHCVEKYHFTLSFSQIKIAVNHSYVSPSYHLENGDELVFVPPVAGG